MCFAGAGYQKCSWVWSLNHAHADPKSESEFVPKAGVCEMNLFNLFAPKMQAQMKLWNYKKVLLNLHICQKKPKGERGFCP